MMMIYPHIFLGRSLTIEINYSNYIYIKIIDREQEQISLFISFKFFLSYSSNQLIKVFLSLERHHQVGFF
jgi:hypothetical protein